MNNGQFEFDRMFDAAFEAAAGQPPDQAADHSPSWQRVQQRIIAQRAKKNLRSKLARLSVIAASLIIGAAVFGNTQAAKAIEPLYASLKEYPSGVMTFIFGRSDDADASKAKTSAPPEFTEGMKVETLGNNLIGVFVTRDQAANRLSFRAPAFNYVPEGFAFSEAEVYYFEGRDKADQVTYTFQNKEGFVISFTLRKLQSGTGLSVPIQKEGVTNKKLQLNGKSVLLTYTDNSSAIETIDGDIHILLTGPIKKEDVVRIYENMYD